MYQVFGSIGDGDGYLLRDDKSPTVFYLNKEAFFVQVRAGNVKHLKWSVSAGKVISSFSEDTLNKATHYIKDLGLANSVEDLYLRGMEHFETADFLKACKNGVCAVISAFKRSKDGKFKIDFTIFGSPDDISEVNLFLAGVYGIYLHPQCKDFKGSTSFTATLDAIVTDKLLEKVKINFVGYGAVQDFLNLKAGQNDKENESIAEAGRVLLTYLQGFNFCKDDEIAADTSSDVDATENVPATESNPVVSEESNESVAADVIRAVEDTLGVSVEGSFITDPSAVDQMDVF